MSTEPPAPPDLPDGPPTIPAAPSPLRRTSVIPRPSWAFEREPDTGKVRVVKVICSGCSREFRMSPPRFTVNDDGEVLARDEGAAFRCTTCDTPIGPLILADWRLGRM